MKQTIFALICLTFPAHAQDNIVDLDPGLWAYESKLSVLGQGVVDQQTYQTCLTPDEAKVDINSLIADIMEGDCKQNSFVHTSGSAELSATCRNVEDQTVINGSLTVQYSSSAYSGTVRATITGPGGSTDAETVTAAQRIGDC